MSTAAAVLAAALAALLAAGMRGWLTPGGLAAAVAVGAGVWSGLGTAGLLLLLLFFLSSVGLGRVGRRWGDRRGPGAPRRAVQVLANGGVAAVAAAAHAVGLLPAATAAAGAVGALAAATADTWASEVGRAVAGPTVAPSTLQRVPPGTTGGVSAAGSLAAVAGAGALAAAAAWLRPAGAGGWLAAGLTGGLGGAVLDSLLGDLLERRLGLVGNEAVNAAATAAGAALAAWLAGSAP